MFSYTSLEYVGIWVTNLVLVSCTLAIPGSMKMMSHVIQKKLHEYFGIEFDNAVLDKKYIYAQVWTGKERGDGKHYYIPHEKLNPKYLKRALKVYEQLLENPETVVHDEKKFNMLINGIKVKPNDSLFKNKKDEENIYRFYCLPNEKSFRINGTATFKFHQHQQ